MQHFLEGLPRLRNLPVQDARPVGQLRPQQRRQFFLTPITGCSPRGGQAQPQVGALRLALLQTRHKRRHVAAISNCAGESRNLGAIVGFSADDLARRPLLIQFVRDQSGQGTIGAVKGTIDAVFALTVGALLTSAEGARLRRCKDETCGRYFVRTGKMKQCSKKCGRRVYMRAFRRGEVGEEARA